MNLLIVLSCIIYLRTINGQLLFPDDERMQVQEAALAYSAPVPVAPLQAPPNLAVPPPSTPIPIADLANYRGSAIYENIVNRIIANGVATFTLSIDKIILSQQIKNQTNVIFAPVSISAALALILLGSNGKTFREVANTMGLATGVDIETKSQLVHENFGRLLRKLERNSGFNVGSQVNFASAIFVQMDYPIRTVYKTAAENIYKSEVLNLDFKSNPSNAQQVINAWVSDRTQGKIKEVLAEQPSSGTKVILASAMYFKAEWEYPFIDGSTKVRPFYTNGKSSKSNVLVPMMANGGDFPYYKDSTINCEILGFPYKGNLSTMYVIKPFDSDAQKLRQLSDKLTADDLERLVSNTKYTEAIVLFPKMRIESTVDLRSPLEALGMHSLFNPAEANLALLSPGISTPPPGVAAQAASQALPASVQKAEHNPIAPETSDDDDSVLIFSRMGELVNCSQIFDPKTNISTCQEVVNVNNTVQKNVIYKKFGEKVGRRIARDTSAQSLDTIRQHLNKGNQDDLENPGLYADRVIHKVYMDITESGTEAAAVTAVSIARDSGRLTFRVDVPFMFFIRNEETKLILFWGSVNTPTPNEPNPN